MDSVYVALGVQVGLVVVPFLLPNEAVKKIGYGAGSFLSGVMGQKLGKSNGQKVEGYFRGTVDSFVAGLEEGMASDDAS